jgi:NAD(P)-dependent dehydrogenase (short-subunit alcohol dehydrogenase family)
VTERYVVTGAARGIGRAVAEVLLDEGAPVLAADLDAGGLAPLADRGAEVLVADLAAAEGRAALVAAAGAVTHLVNSAGVIRMTPLEEVDEALWDWTFAINARAVFFLCQALVPRMPPGGAVVNLSSTAAKTGSTLEGAVYAAAKAAVLSITRTFAHAHAARGVRVNAVCPGITDTPMQDDVLARLAAHRGTTADEVHQARLATVPMRRSATPRECAAVIRFLLSDAAGYMTGQAINVSGGLVMY